MISTPSVDPEFYVAALPVFILILGCLVTMLQSVFRFAQGQVAVATSLLVFPVLSLVCVIFVGTENNRFLGGAWLTDSYSSFAQSLLLVAGILLILMSWFTWIRDHFFKGEIACLYQMSLLGMLVMVSSDDLISVFIGLELSSVGIYALVGYLTPDRQSQEGAIKYFVLGSFATAVLLFGFGMLYASTGSLSLSHIFALLNEMQGEELSLWMKLGAVCTLCGFSFKFSLAPFHLWAPDAYESAPTGISALMATCGKVMVMVVILRVFSLGMPLFQSQFGSAMAILAFISVFAGNIMALVQTSLKRMFAYSSVAHSGYMAIALCSVSIDNAGARQAILFYLLTYTVASLVAFGILMWLEDSVKRNLCLNDLRGLVKDQPWKAFHLSVALFSMAGMPPTIGFLGKFFVFSAALEKGHYILAVAGALGSTVALFYYLRIIVFMYMKPADHSVSEPLRPVHSSPMAVILALGLSAIILGGTLLPAKIFDSLKPLSVEAVLSPELAKNRQR